ncbi:MAG: NAD(P)-dependent oxidoreductase [Hyphomicrobium sp.]|uniref:NAD-dependent epimerase/dehydratase family protein n=1 Tax=Hyphomicrobium sp. TaxID=82 RepID=UPI0025BF2B58|nr:NAD(P)-dependent oxidoreductase [Hyphomicrobium sp.]MBZ0211761.1 NAD(P)-dependent oxidoreductase [Hyphomicrobium sp.]
MTGAKPKVLVTGATGFVGRHCVPKLLERGFDVHGISLREPASRTPDVTWHRYDLLDPAACHAVVKALQPSHVLHLAWITKPGVFWSSAENLAWMTAGAALLQACAAAGARVVVSGTCAEYAASNAPLQEETTPLRPDTVYGHAKAGLFHAFEALRMTSALDGAWARLFFPYGPDEPAGRLIPGAIECILQRREFACTDGRQTRDFIYVTDVADALCTLLQSDALGAFNIGSGAATELRDVVSRIANRLRGAELVCFGARPRPPNDPDFVVADRTSMQRACGWSASVSLEDGLDRTIDNWRGRIAVLSRRPK